MSAAGMTAADGFTMSGPEMTAADGFTMSGPEMTAADGFTMSGAANHLEQATHASSRAGAPIQ